MRVGLMVVILGILVIFSGTFFFGEESFFTGLRNATSTATENTEDGEEKSDEIPSVPPSESEQTYSPPPITNTAPPPAPTVQTPSLPATTNVNIDLFVVIYSNNGFSPSKVELEAGKTVRFVNASERTLWVTSRDVPGYEGQLYPEFNQGKSSVRGETYSFVFTKQGEWGYKNLNDEKHTGVIVVTPQK